MYIKIPAELFQTHLSSSAFKVYCILSSCMNASDRTACIRMSRIAEISNMSRTTVNKAINELLDLELIEKKNQYKADGTYRSNLYRLSSFGSNKWTAVPVNSFVLDLPPAAFMVYAAMLSFRGKNGKAFPSLRHLQNLLGLCCNTITKAINTLISVGLLRKARYWSGKHNLYLVALIKLNKKRKGATATNRNAQSPKLSNTTFDNSILAFALSKVKLSFGLFCLKRVYHFLYIRPISTLATKQKKELSILIAKSIPIDRGKLTLDAFLFAEHPMNFYFVLKKGVNRYEFSIQRISDESRHSTCQIQFGQLRIFTKRFTALPFFERWQLRRMAQTKSHGLSQPNQC